MSLNSFDLFNAQEESTNAIRDDLASGIYQATADEQPPADKDDDADVSEDDDDDEFDDEDEDEEESEADDAKADE